MKHVTIDHIHDYENKIMTIKRRDTSKKRNAILDAAIEAFKAQGYDNASMDYIAELANASKRTVYNHFPSKEILFQSVMSRFIDEMMEVKRVEYNPALSLEEQLGQIADAKMAIAHNESWLGIMKVSLAVMVSHAELAKNTMEYVASQDDYLGDWMQAAVDDGKLNITDVAAAAELLGAMFAGSFFWPTLLNGPRDEQESERLKQEYIRVFLNTYQVQ
jgi:TetR/AcrR family transcriptional regulator of autoinduction and epiphytic fitness